MVRQDAPYTARAARPSAPMVTWDGISGASAVRFRVPCPARSPWAAIRIGRGHETARLLRSPAVPHADVGDQGRPERSTCSRPGSSDIFPVGLVLDVHEEQDHQQGLGATDDHHEGPADLRNVMERPGRRIGEERTAGQDAQGQEDVDVFGDAAMIVPVVAWPSASCPPSPCPWASRVPRKRGLDRSS